jgi:trehalose 6-phosphate synthase/phosphatase
MALPSFRSGPWQIRAWELKDELRDLVSNLNLEIMDGDKVIEVKNSGINKGRAAARQLARGKI